MTVGTALRRKILGLSLEEAGFARRGFPALQAPARPHLEHVGRGFLYGYLAALEEKSPAQLSQRLDRTMETPLRGFAFEGAAMALALLDRLTPWNRGRFAVFLAGPAAGHVYMLHVGLGLAWARLRRPIAPALATLDPLLGWLAVDGCGFHEGYFHWRRSFEAQHVPPRIIGYQRRVFDQGLGRSLWFVEGAQVSAIVARIERFSEIRRADLWSGVGLACAYAGGAAPDDMLELRDAAGPHQPVFLQGVAFAAQARRRAGNMTENTETACRILCRMTADQAGDITQAALENLPPDGDLPAFEHWRRRVARRLTSGPRSDAASGTAEQARVAALV